MEERQKQHLTYAGSSSPPAPDRRLAAAYDKQLAEAFTDYISGGEFRLFFGAVFRHARRKLANVGKDFGEGHRNADDLAQTLAIKLAHHVVKGMFSGKGEKFAAWVNTAVRNKGRDFIRAAVRDRNRFVPLLVTQEDEDGEEEQVENRDVSRAMAYPPCSTRRLPIDPGWFGTKTTAKTKSLSKYSTADVMQVFCDETKFGDVRYSNKRKLPPLSTTDAAIVEAIRNGDDYAEAAAKVSMTTKQVENRLNTIRRRERKKQDLAGRPPLRIKAA